MKKNWGLIISSIVIYLTLGLIVSIYLIVPGINKLKEANNIKELTYEEKTELIDNINEKYLNLENQTINKYTPNINQINQKYDESKNSIIKKYNELNAPITQKYNKLESSIKQKYSNLEKTIKQKYDNLEKQIKAEIIEVEHEKDQEFWKNQFSKKYYELSEKLEDLHWQEWDLDSEEKAELNNNTAAKNKELSNNTTAKNKELSNNESSKNKEISTNENNRNSELKTIEVNKQKELDSLDKEKTKEINNINNQNSNKDSIRGVGVSKFSIGIIILLIPLLYIITVFNRLTHLSNSVKEKWSQIEVLLKQRADLLPNIVETIKGASTHEKTTLTKITKARNQFLKATTKEEEIAASKNLSKAINNIFILKETYPELKTNRNFMDLQDNLEEIENKISFSRQTYNKAVLKYKNKLEMFPSNIIANIFSFEPELFFEADENDKENPNINFN